MPIKSQLSFFKGDDLLVALYIMEEKVEEKRGGKGQVSHSFQIFAGDRLEY